VLQQVSQQVAANPFTARKIKDLIARLMVESSVETEHKSGCDNEVTTSKMTLDAKMAEVASLASQIEDLTAPVAHLCRIWQTWQLISKHLKRQWPVQLLIA